MRTHTRQAPNLSNPKQEFPSMEPSFVKCLVRAERALVQLCVLASFFLALDPSSIFQAALLCGGKKK